MKMSLEKWQEHLETHFGKLVRIRSSSGLPIFALEHGLSEEDIDELSIFLRAHLAANRSLQPHWLAWVVYAAEEGYTYTGEEYWRSFEGQTPSWEAQHRNQMRDWFKKFQKKYNGVEPSGAWAEHFRIIAWPITHAILPRYLQRHFARTLFDLRFRLVKLTSVEPVTIGRMIASHVYHSSSRFEEFLQQEELVGRIVLAILDRDPDETGGPLLRATLDRIVIDLENVRHAREWLKEARHVVSDRFKDIGRGSGPPDDRSGITPGGWRRESIPNILPDILLRHTGGGSWMLAMDVPNFKCLTTLNAEIREFLKKTRCSLNGGEGVRAAGWIMSGNRRAVLKSWPDPDKPLVRFERHQEDVDRLLADGCRMTEGPDWLFRIGNDGIARQITSRIVRPGFDYILAMKNSITDLLNGMGKCSIDCKGIEAIRISVPDRVSDEYIQWLANLQLRFDRTIRVWPAGFRARKWDGEGRSEWLTTERPCFGIVSDHSVISYEISLKEVSSTLVPAKEMGHPTFLQLPHLDVGMHTLMVTAHKSAVIDGVEKTSSHTGYVALSVREPEPWVPGITAHAGLIVSGDPHDANLDTLWDNNEYHLSVMGSENRSVNAEVILEDGMGEKMFSGHVFESVDLPITPKIWRERFKEFQKRERCEWRHLDASAGVLRISGQELGEFSIQFEHEALPLRWVRRIDQGKLMIRLVDDTGQQDCDPKCLCLSMEQPVKVVHPKVVDLLSGLEVQPPGCLLLAQSGNHQDLIIVSLGVTAEGFQGLGVTPDCGTVSKEPSAIVAILRILCYWQSARLTGFVAAARQKYVVDGLMNAIYGALCGLKWAEAENRFAPSLTATQAKKRKRAIENLQARIGQRGGFGTVLCRDAAKSSYNIDAITKWYCKLAVRYGVCADTQLCAFAIALASTPHKLPKPFPDNLEGWLKRLLTCPALMRGARLSILLCENNRSEQGMKHPRLRK